MGDARRFTEGLAEVCKERGVTFRLNTAIDGLAVDGGRVTALKTASGEIKADAFVPGRRQLFAAARAPISTACPPIYPVKGL